MAPPPPLNRQHRDARVPEPQKAGPGPNGRRPREDSTGMQEPLEYPRDTHTHTLRSHCSHRS
eukprot:5330063-Pyramimonas_sp.AAC.1